MRVTLIESPLANLASIGGALRAVGADVLVTSDPAQIESSERIVLPGVGSFDRAAAWLGQRRIDAALQTAVSRGAALLGICLGHQLLFGASEEGDESRGLGLIDGRSSKMRTSLPVPHIGWNSVEHSADPLFREVASGAHFYFVHSFAVECGDRDAIARSEYGSLFVAAARRGRVCGVQFHPEKSSRAGLQLLRNFLELI